MNKELLNILQQLHKLSGRPGFSCVRISGAPGTGKTALLNRFAAETDGIYFAFANRTERMNLRALATVLGVQANTWEALLEKLPDSRPVILDNAGSLFSANRGAAAALERLAEKLPRDTRIMLCVADTPDRLKNLDRVPGLSTFLLLSGPFGALKSAFPDYSPLERLMLYTASGGNPKRLSALSSGCSLKENLVSLAGIPLQTDDPLECSLMAVLAEAPGSLPRLADAVGVTERDCRLALKNLSLRGWVCRRGQASEALYACADTGEAFACLFGKETGSDPAEAVYTPAFVRLTEECFRRLAREYVRKTCDFAQPFFAELHHPDFTVAPVCLETGKNIGIFCSCLLSGSPADRNDLDRLAVWSHRFFPQINQCSYRIFSAYGGSLPPECTDAALVSLEQMEEIL